MTADSQYSHFFNGHYSTTVATTKVHGICQRNLSATKGENKGQSVDIVQPTFNNWSNLIIIIIIKQNFIHRFKKKIDYLQIQEYEILKYIPYVHFSCLRKRIVVK